MSAPNPAIRRIVLVEGVSDRVALQTLASRDGRDLRAEGIEIVAMGGITNTRTFARRFGPQGADVPLAGLYDAPEEEFVRRGLADAGISPEHSLDDLAAVGFFKCTRDLEDELLRALGVDGVESVIEANGDGRSLRLLAQMPAQVGWSRAELLRRFMTSQSGRKARYAELLVESLAPEQVPAPLRDLLASI